MFYTTLALAREKRVCHKVEQALRKAKEHEGKEYKDDTPIPLTVVLQYADDQDDPVYDTLQCLKAVPREDEKDAIRIKRLFAADCAENVLLIFESAYPEDGRLRNAIEVARKFTRGEATQTELAAAQAAAQAAYKVARSVSDKTYGIGRAGGPQPGWQTACRITWVAHAVAFEVPWAAQQARKGERGWQIERLRLYLNNEM